MRLVILARILTSGMRSRVYMLECLYQINYPAGAFQNIILSRVHVRSGEI